MEYITAIYILYSVIFEIILWNIRKNALIALIIVSIGIPYKILLRYIDEPVIKTLLPVFNILRAVACIMD